ncbi:deoxyribonuclease V [Uliginosibacterium sp. sgz301328]|uniref:deoxyribonuclease V n=1 Tax=Uliginosibacterium sp. sgz301328 TaxID=3243764 RepID=UPI00359D88B3
MAQPHRWDLTPKEAVAVQREVAQQVVTADDFGPVNKVAGVDVGFEQNGTVTRAAVAVLSWPGLELIDRAVARRPTHFPYVPGLLSFREIPAILDAFERLKTSADLVLVDGQGIAHPRRCGIASHLGVVADMATIGVGKSRLTGTHGELPTELGAWIPLMDRGDIIGAVLRNRANTQPLFISSGHRVSLDSALHWVRACTTRYRLPETTRWAHRLASGPAID